MTNQISSSEIYLSDNPHKVISTVDLFDDSMGVYPVDYTSVDDRLLCSSSVYNLVSFLGSFEPNLFFDPPRYFHVAKDRGSEFKLDVKYSGGRVSGLINKLVKRLRFSYKDNRWYESWQTADKRIFKLRPFEYIKNQREPKDSNEINIGNLAERSAKALQEHVNRIEKRFSEYIHIAEVSGFGYATRSMSVAIRGFRLGLS